MGLLYNQPQFSASPVAPSVRFDRTVGWELVLVALNGEGAKPGRGAALTMTYRAQLAEVFAQSTAMFPRWAKSLAEASDRATFVAREFEVLPIYLGKYLQTGDSAYLALLVGERIKAFHDTSMSADDKRQLVASACAYEALAIQTTLGPCASAGDVAPVLSALARVHQQLLPKTAKAKRVLLVGDCLFLDVVAFVVGPLQALGLTLEFEYITSKNPVELGRQVRALKGHKFDLVFFSPFSYEFALEHVQLLKWRHAFWPAARVEQEALALAQGTEAVLQLLSDAFECPVVVHNYSGMLRDERPLVRRLKLLATQRNRDKVKRLCNQLLIHAVDRINKATFRHVQILDEAALVDKAGLFEAGAYFHKSELQHPAVLGKLLASDYVDLIYANAVLVGRKLVVCDLDNTLWDGVIGEGGVSHFHDRQQTLQRLKQRGVVLAILSKNDPANVHWTNGTLTADDFVFSSISWSPKVQGMKRIEQGLNMKMKDFLFIDDREDERELMEMTHPQVLTLDATDQGVWHRLSRWADALDDEPGMDRTLMYKQREERMAFTGAEEGEAAANAELFKSLQLKADIAEAGVADLKRVAELINRTNQFNLQGSRTSFQEVSQWHQSPDHVILVAKTSDRFGDMGITCVAVMSLSGHEARILPFVLSCRVFGYGIERAVLNRLKRLASARGIRVMEGVYAVTPQNAPCKSFLPDNLFVQQGGVWRCDLTQDQPADEPWLVLAGN